MMKLKKTECTQKMTVHRIEQMEVLSNKAKMEIFKSEEVIKMDDKEDKEGGGRDRSKGKG